MESIQSIDARKIAPREKHPTIFQVFDDLPAGEHFILVNDHEPRPLNHQFQNERPGEFTWEYLEQGPEIWRVAIGKLESVAEPTVGEIIAQDFRKAEVFKRHGIDFCCGGKKSLSQASSEAGIDPQVLKAELNDATTEAGIGSLDRFQTWSIPLLIQYILENHHNWLKTKLPEMVPLVQKVSKVHGANHPETVKIASVFQAIVDDLVPHMQKEEIMLFPYIEKIVAAERSGEEPPRPVFGSVENPLRGMEADHEVVGELMDSIRALSQDYTIPEDACASFRLVYGFLSEMEDDLHQHIHLENNILHPKVRELAQKLGV
ncbi:MAG: iron-sulfur cluster repair di-iron protein [Candidatus Marinimicrobia bacterium]|nr:iron-sulfur cluster repair di-iron protein [Candidatus Neomarinimicrobiota bacterium]MCF7840267.1 iron-sulfur cluster repair di-iron protein [Candidatus Neomarinimicrobiota bacterium]